MANLDEQLNKLKIDKAKRRRSNGLGGRWLVLAGIVLVAMGGYGVYSKLYAAVPVKTAPVERETVVDGKGTAALTASGYIVPCQKIEVSSMIIGRVKEILVKRGDRVKAGDVLIRIEDEEYKSRVESGDAMVATLKARLEELKAGSRPQEIEAANAAVSAAEATLKNAELEVRRLEQLDREGAVARQEVDRARTARDVALAQLDGQKKNAELVRIGPREEQIKAVEAQLRQSEADLGYARTMLDYTLIKAPIDGVILEKVAEQGEMVTNMNFGGTRGAKSSVVSMADLGCLNVEVDVNEGDLSKVRLDQPCEIRLDSQPDRVYEGKVDEISPQADRQKGTVQIKVRITNPEDSIKIEVNARVTFLDPSAETGASGGSAKPRAWVPKNAVVKSAGGDGVYVVLGDVAQFKKIATNGETDRGVEVTDGLDGVDAVVLEPPSRLGDGARVRVMP